MEGDGLSLEPPLGRGKAQFAVTPARPIEAELRVQIEQDRAMGSPVEWRLLVEQLNELEIESAGESLVRQGRVEKPVAQYVHAGGQARLHELPQMLHAIGDVEEELRHGLDPRDLAP